MPAPGRNGHHVYVAFSKDKGCHWSKPEHVNRGTDRTAIYPWLAAGRGLAAGQGGDRVVHRGGVCQGGVTCGASGNDNRDLYDDFGIAASPRTGYLAPGAAVPQRDVTSATAYDPATGMYPGRTACCLPSGPAACPGLAPPR